MDYSPPCSITPQIINLVAEIAVLVGRISGQRSKALSLRLRRTNQIRTIQGTLAIEGNTLSANQITAILEGKRVLAPPSDIQEVRNALKAYEALKTWQFGQLDDLLAAHRMLMSGLLDDPGKFRPDSVGIMKGDQILHLAPPAENVPFLMKQLLHWLSAADHHPLIKSSIFHYEFEFIHPFVDGNGRMGRLWQTLILSTWEPVFSELSVESLVHQHQAEYYQAINESTSGGDSSPFVSFMLKMIHQAIMELAPEVTPQVTPEVEKLLQILTEPRSRKELQDALNLKDEKNFRERYLIPAIKAGLVELTVPEKPNSRLQKYRKLF